MDEIAVVWRVASTVEPSVAMLADYWVVPRAASSAAPMVLPVVVLMAVCLEYW